MYVESIGLCRMTQYSDTKAAGGAVDSGSTTRSQCEENCINSATCWAYDWASDTSQCRHLDFSNYTNRQSVNDGTVHVEVSLCSVKCKFLSILLSFETVIVWPLKARARAKAKKIKEQAKKFYLIFLSFSTVVVYSLCVFL